MGEKRIKVLVVDDEVVVRDFLNRLLGLYPVEVKIADNGFKAVEFAKQDKFDLVFLDIRMPGINGLETFRELKKIDPDFNCVFMTGYAAEADSLLLKFPGTACLKKPFADIQQIQDIINKVKARSQVNSAGINEVAGIRDGYFRFDIVLEVDYKLKDAPGCLNQNHFSSKDITPGGIRIFITEEISPGTVLEMVIKFTEFCETLNAAVEVLWIKESGEKPGFFEAGVKFVEIDLTRFAGFLINSTKSVDIRRKA